MRWKKPKDKIKVPFLTSYGSQFPNIVPHILTTFVQIFTPRGRGRGRGTATCDFWTSCPNAICVEAARNHTKVKVKQMCKTRGLRAIITCSPAPASLSACCPNKTLFFSFLYFTYYKQSPLLLPEVWFFYTINLTLTATDFFSLWERVQI